MSPPFAIERVSLVARPLEEVFAFFSRAKNLVELTPPAFRLRILEAPEELEEGAVIRYALRVRGIPFRWSSRICEWNPPHGFADEQLTGPYRTWVHHHRFRAVEGEGGPGTAVTDSIRYTVLGGSLVNRLFVAPDLEKLFDYRRQRIQELFGR